MSWNIWKLFDRKPAAQPAGNPTEQTSKQVSSNAIRLIVGLGNPGAEYQSTRHNIGARWVSDIANEHAITLHHNNKFLAEVGRGKIADHEVRLLIPLTYMNRSGLSVGKFARYFHLQPSEILVVHDEIAFPPGVAKIKIGGGLNGHNGLASVVNGLGGSNQFLRLRIGVGHPGDRDLVTPYLTKKPMPRAEQEQALECAQIGVEIFKLLFSGKPQHAMTLFHQRSLDP